MEKLNSLEKLRERVGLKPLGERQEKNVMCRKCGAEMKKVALNTWHCTNEIKQKDGKTKTCGNIYIRHNYN